MTEANELCKRTPNAICSWLGDTAELTIQYGKNKRL